MPDIPNHRASDRLRVELIEADVDMAFSLVDDTREEFHEGNVELAHAALDDANNVVRNIEERLAKLDFEGRRAVWAARQRAQGYSRGPSRVRATLRSIVPSRSLVVFFLHYTLNLDFDEGGPCLPAKNSTN